MQREISAAFPFDLKRTRVQPVRDFSACEKLFARGLPARDWRGGCPVRDVSSCHGRVRAHRILTSK
jgi:hypothetical protein